MPKITLELDLPEGRNCLDGDGFWCRYIETRTRGARCTLFLSPDDLPTRLWVMNGVAEKCDVCKGKCGIRS